MLPIYDPNYYGEKEINELRDIIAQRGCVVRSMSPMLMREIGVHNMWMLVNERDEKDLILILYLSLRDSKAFFVKKSCFTEDEINIMGDIDRVVFTVSLESGRPVYLCSAQDQ